MDNLFDNQPPQITSTTTSAIDFKLEIKIEISSGKCILHASKITNKDEFTNHLPPDTFYYGMDYHSQTGPNRLLHPPNSRVDETDMRNTNFIFPAIKMKAFYESSHKSIDHHLSKKANLYAMIRLESFVMPVFTKEFPKKDHIIVSRDMCISPALLDFLEQALEPLDTLRTSLESATLIATPLAGRFNRDQQSTLKSQKENVKPNDVLDDKYDETPIRKNTSTEMRFADKDGQKPADSPSYFPIEVVAFVSMQPSSIRFTCLPQSTMECLLKLPTLEMVFSTYKSIDSNLKETIYNELNDDLPQNGAKLNGIFIAYNLSL